MSDNTPEAPTTTVEEIPLKKRFGLSGNRRSAMLFGAAGMAVILALGIPLYLHAISTESTDDAFFEAHVVSMSSRVAGHVERVLIEDNQMVKEGQVLAELDPRDYQVALDVVQARMQSAKAAVVEAEALVSAAQSGVMQAEAGLQSQHSGLAQMRAEVAEVKAGHDRDQGDLGRMRQIANVGAVSRQEFDHAKAQEAMALAKLNSVRRQVDTRSATIMEAQAKVKAAEEALNQAYAQVDVRNADLREAEAEVEQAKLNLSYTHILAPCDGHVTKKALEAGSYVQVGQKLFSIVSPKVWVVANFKETQISNMRAGQPVEIEVDSYPDTPFHGHVDSIQRGTGSRFSLLPPENATGNFIKVVQRVPVKIVLDEQPQTEHVLAPGMSVLPTVDISVTDGEILRAANTAPMGLAAK